MTQAEALARLRHGTIVEKRGAAMRLAAIGDAAAVPVLAEALTSKDPALVGLAEQALWEIWCRSGIPEVDAVLREGMAAMERGNHDSAAALFTRVIQMAPDFPEGYNKRATAYYLAGQHRLAIAMTPSGDSEGLRFSAQIYNSMEEVDRAVAAVKAIAG